MNQGAERVAPSALVRVQQIILVLVLALLVGPRDAVAQSEPRVHRIGLLCYLPCPNAMTKLLTDELLEMGYVPGKNAVFEYRHADGKTERYPQAVQELIDQRVEVIFLPPPPGHAQRSSLRVLSRSCSRPAQILWPLVLSTRWKNQAAT